MGLITNLQIFKGYKKCYFRNKVLPLDKIPFVYIITFEYYWRITLLRDENYPSAFHLNPLHVREEKNISIQLAVISGFKHVDQWTPG